MRRRFTFEMILLVCLVVMIGGCSGKKEGKDPAQKGAESPPVSVDVTKVSAIDLDEGIDVVGSLSPKYGADVKSEFPGIATEVYVNEWVRVKKGSPLAKIDTREMEILFQKAKSSVDTAKANLLQAEVAGNRADREYERLLKLKEYGLVTQQNLDDGMTEQKASVARIEAAKAQLHTAENEMQYNQTRLSKTTIRSPIDGIVSLRAVNVGDMVGDMGQARVMFRVVNPALLELTVTVPSGEMGKLRLGQPLLFSSDSIPAKTFTGKVMFINPVVNDSDRSVKVIAEVENSKEELKGGLFVKGRIVIGKRTAVLIIPRTSLLTWDVTGKKAEVFVIQGEKALRKTVGTGSTAGDSVEITSGLAPGEQVIVRGGFNVKDGDRVTVAQAAGK
jgi:membrane fusion protein, multidrug efflux system